MSEFNRAELFARLNPLSYQALEGATAFCKLRGHPYVELVHWVYQLINTTQSDWQVLLQQAEVDEVALEQDILRALDRLPKGRGRFQICHIILMRWYRAPGYMPHCNASERRFVVGIY